MNALTDKEIQLVRKTFAEIEPHAEEVAAAFYGRLFQLDPSLNDLFKSDLGEQGRKLMAMLKTAVKGLNDLEAIVPAVQDLGRRHTGYGVEEKHYGTVGEALLWTLEQGLGGGFTDEVRESWTKVYVTLSSVMKEAAAH